LDAPLSLKSEVGRGSVFLIKLETSDLRVSALPESAHTDTFKRPDLTGTLISVIDDERLILDATSALLAQWGCSVVSATSGNDMVDYLRTCSRVPDVIVCDYRLRGSQTGIEVINLLRTEFNLEIPAILVTGDTSPKRIQEFEASGLTVLHKPVAEKVLRDTIIDML
jgi:CheY-like chemotaxis protein